MESTKIMDTSDDEKWEDFFGKFEAINQISCAKIFSVLWLRDREQRGFWFPGLAKSDFQND